MPQIDPVRWRELSSFLDEALELPGTERLAWLETLRMQRPALADELHILLQRQHFAAPFIRSLVDTEPARPSSVAGTPKVKRALRGDLDNIILKALKKNPLERYCPVGELADDLRRYLRDEPVLARADNAWYRMRKFIARNRLPVGIGAAALIAIIATATIALFEAREAQHTPR